MRPTTLTQSSPIRPIPNRLPQPPINPDQTPRADPRGRRHRHGGGRADRRRRGSRLVRDAVPAHEAPAAVAAGGAHLVVPVLGAGEAAAGALAATPQTVRVAPGPVDWRVAPLLAPVDAARCRACVVARRQRRVRWVLGYCEE